MKQIMIIVKIMMSGIVMDGNLPTFRRNVQLQSSGPVNIYSVGKMYP